MNHPILNVAPVLDGARDLLHTHGWRPPVSPGRHSSPSPTAMTLLEAIHRAAVLHVARNAWKLTTTRNHQLQDYALHLAEDVISALGIEIRRKFGVFLRGSDINLVEHVSARPCMSAIHMMALLTETVQHVSPSRKLT